MSSPSKVRAFLRKLAGRQPRTGATQQYEGRAQGYLCWIDEPVDWRRVPRRFRLAGWCFAADGQVENLRARLGEREVIVSHGLGRPDVAASFPEQPEAGQSGFEVTIELPRGAVHQLNFEAQRSGGEWEKVFEKRIRVGGGPSYEDWIRKYERLRAGDRFRIQKEIENFPRKPRFLVLLTVAEETVYLEAAINSVRAQLYPFWKLVVVLEKEFARKTRRDRRVEVIVRPKERSVAQILNDALAGGDYDYVLTPGSEDKLAPTALYLVAEALNRYPEAQLLYSDEDRLDAAGRRADPQFKPDWNWPLVLGKNFVSQLAVLRADLARSVGFRPGFAHAREYDLLLRCAERIEPAQIHHIPHVLCHRRRAPAEGEDETEVVRQHLARRQIEADVTIDAQQVRRVRYRLPEKPPSVSIIIPTRDRVELLRPCVQSILEKTAYPAFEIFLIDNGTREPAALEYLAALAPQPRLRILRRDEEFNYSRLTNTGVQESLADFVLLLNNDVSVIEPGWLEEMVSQGIQPGVGAVGPRLLYPDNRVQQAGVILGAGVHEVAEVAHRGIARLAPGYFSRAHLAQEFSVLGAACLLVRRAHYLEVGGFDEECLKVAFNDIDFCLKLRARGLRIIFTPHAELYHHEHASRGTEYTAANEERFAREIEFMKAKWGKTLENDPFYNPNLSLGRDLFTLAFPPRVTNPWAASP